MAVQDRTTVFEMRACADIPNADRLITPASVDRHPVRDIDELRRALRDATSVREVASTLECASSDVVFWADVYDLTENLPERRSTEE